MGKFNPMPLDRLKENVFQIFQQKFFCGFDGNITAPDYNYNGGRKRDLFGVLDAFLSFYILDRESVRQMPLPLWFKAILSFQDASHYFQAGDYTFHTQEHSTAYAISVLKLLSKECEECRQMFQQIRLPIFYEKIIKQPNELEGWLNKLGFSFPQYDLRLSFKHNLRLISKRLGWHNIWPSSHIGGGVAAAIAMISNNYINQGLITSPEFSDFFERYFSILDNRINKKYGVWKEGVFDFFWRSVNHRDIGGAVHFYWVYDHLGRNYLYPERLVSSCIKFGRANGLIKDKPFCIDFDFTYLVNRSMKHLSYDFKDISSVDFFMYNNYQGIIEFYSKRSNFDRLNDSHSIPGALASLIEVEDYFKSRGFFVEGQTSRPFDTICWL